MLKLSLIAWVTANALTPTVAAAAQTVEFSGYTWQVRDYGGGPGPNSWDPANVFVDEAGLHLRVTQTGGTWNAAEVVMTVPLGFGTYSFEVAGRPDQLDKNVVLGLFSYPGSADVGPDGTNEIDIEFARWGSSKTEARLHWTVHAPVEGQAVAQKSRTATIGEAGSTHSYRWSAKGVTYSWVQGSDAAAKPAASWAFMPKSPAKRVPQVPLVVHMNLWLFEGKPPSAGRPVEVVIRSFSFTPE